MDQVDYSVHLNDSRENVTNHHHLHRPTMVRLILLRGRSSPRRDTWSELRFDGEIDFPIIFIGETSYVGYNGSMKMKRGRRRNGFERNYET